MAESQTSISEPELPPISPRDPSRAVVCSALGIGWGQMYNRQLDKAVLLWIWTAIVLGLGAVLGFAGLLGSRLPRGMVRPPLADWVGDHGGLVLGLWLGLLLMIWAGNVRDAYLSALAINEGRIRIRYGLRRQWVHLLGSQLLGLIPIIGFLFPPGIVAEGIDAAHGRRAPDHKTLIREGGQALLEWALTRIAVYTALGAFALWLLWWALRALKLAP